MIRSLFYLLFLTLLFSIFMTNMSHASTTSFLELSHQRKTGNTERDSFGAKAGKSFSNSDFEFALSAFFDYETSNEKRITNKGGGIVSADLNLTKLHGLFVFEVSKFDEFRKIKFRSESAFGYKYSIFLQKGKLSLSGALMYEHTEFDPPDVSNIMRASFRVKLSQKVFQESHFQHITFYKPRVKDSSDFSITTETFLSVPLNNVLKIKIAVESEFDNKPQPGVRKDDTSIKTSLAIHF